MNNTGKEYDKDKILKFLSKVNTKLDQKVEEVGSENKIVLCRWIEELKGKEEKTIVVDFDEKLFNDAKNN